METQYSFQKPDTFMYFWLSYCDENHTERIPVAVKNIDHLFSLAGEIIKDDNLHLSLLFAGKLNFRHKQFMIIYGRI